MLFLPDGEIASFVRYKESIHRRADEKYDPTAQKPPIIHDCDARWTLYYQNAPNASIVNTMEKI